MLFEIKNRFTEIVIFSHEADDNTMLKTLRAAIDANTNLSGADLSGADLRGANLSGADLSGAALRGANLSGADLRGADLRGANLSCANLSGANLSDADLSGAYLRGANLSGADLRCANLSDADLRGADLSGVNLSGADLSGANLSCANLRLIRDDIWAVLSSAPSEVPALIEALKTGRVDGSTYVGDCTCLVGTIANARQVHHERLGNGLTPNSSRPAERFFMGIKKGDIPETNPVSKLALEWSVEWLDRMQQAFGPKPETEAVVKS